MVAVTLPPTTIGQRKSVNALTANELMSLRRGVAQMMAWNTAPRDSADFRRSWLYWANMHAHFGSELCGPPDQRAGDGGRADLHGLKCQRNSHLVQMRARYRSSS